MRTELKQKLAVRRHWRVRRKVSGTRERPRMSVCFTNQNIHVQFIDDAARVTLAANAASAKKIGSLAAQAALAKGIKQVVFDRGSALYHGKVKALADAAREAGLQF